MSKCIVSIPKSNGIKYRRKLFGFIFCMVIIVMSTYSYGVYRKQRIYIEIQRRIENLEKHISILENKLNNVNDTQSAIHVNDKINNNIDSER